MVEHMRVGHFSTKNIMYRRDLTFWTSLAAKSKFAGTNMIQNCTCLKRFQHVMKSLWTMKNVYRKDLWAVWRLNKSRKLWYEKDESTTRTQQSMWNAHVCKWRYRFYATKTAHAFYDCGTSRKRLKHDCTQVFYDNKCYCHEGLRLQCDYACTCTTTTAQLMTTGTRQQSQSDTISYRLWHEWVNTSM